MVSLEQLGNMRESLTPYRIHNRGGYSLSDVRVMGTELPFESTPTLARGSMYFNRGEWKGTITQCKLVRPYYGNAYYEMYTAESSWRRWNLGPMILVDDLLIDVEMNDAIIVLDREKLSSKRRSCRMCISTCISKICDFYEPYLNTINWLHQDIIVRSDGH